ncbi:MAG: TetR/AcrR family transcriptional regulator [Bacilli bacterium]|nr:TetR/AcrR family transcriptional regulator [Bacilli bacterium]
MDKRSEKTVNAIYEAFAKLINEKDYDEITIQDLLDKANISRSTFYAHYKTKDELLLSISNHIFEHVFSKSLQEEKTHDFSKDLILNYRHLIEHIFYHVRDEKELFVGILSNKVNSLFLMEFRKHFSKFVTSYYANYPMINNSIPVELRKSLAIEDFIVVLKYWVKNNFKEDPEEIAEFYIKSAIK